MKRWDRRALEGLPLKLLIMSLLISLTAPAVLGSLDGFERSTARSCLEVEASRLWRMVEEVVSAGEGNRRTILLSLPDSLNRYGLIMAVGGKLDEVGSLGIRCCCDGAVYSNMVLDDPPGRLTSVDGSVIELGSGKHLVTVECQRLKAKMIAVVSVLR